MIELIKNHPLSSKIIVDYFNKQFLESLEAKSLPEEFKESMKEVAISENSVGIMIGSQPRALFDVFDENDIFIEILYMEKAFHYTISDGNEIVSSNIQNYPTRKDAEKAAIQTAFSIFEEKLNYEGQNS